MDTHEMMFNLVEFYYNFGCYSAEDVTYFVGYNALTPNDYKSIIGKDYVATNSVPTA